MPTEPSSDVKFEIGHVLFIDIVGYSKLLITEQSEHLQTLKQIVRGTEQFRLAEAEGKMLRLPTGDGGALVFRTSPEAPVLCALEISKALKSHPELRVRMGIHSGPVNEISDLNEQANIAGAGINVAERVMDCGDAGHILLSQHVAEEQIALSYQALWRYADSIAALDRASAIMPDNVETRTARGLFYLCWKADTRPLRQTIDAILAQGAGAIVSAAGSWFFCALAERDPGAAERALVALGDNPCWNESTIILSRSFGEGLLARMTKDEARARTAFEAARAQQEKIVQAQPDYGPALCVLGLIDAALGRKDLALDEGRRAIALTPVEKDVYSGSLVLQYFAITAAWAGDKEPALQQLETGLRAPAAALMLSYGALKLFPVWDPLRGDPRFEQIVASLAPKEPPK
jgi:tetratricopeptide (TPR) repeat protein